MITKIYLILNYVLFAFLTLYSFFEVLYRLDTKKARFVMATSLAF